MTTDAAPALDAAAVAAVFTDIGIVHQLASARLAAVLPGGLSVAQFGILNHFARLGGAYSLVALARAFQVTKPTMGELVEKLRRKGLVAVERDPEDARGKRVALTEAGRAAHRQALAALAPEMAALAGLVGADLLAELAPRLRRLRETLDAARALSKPDNAP